MSPVELFVTHIMPPSVTAGFELNMARVQLINWMSAGFSIASFLLCISILVASWFVFRCPAARPSLDRISFRLLMWTMVVWVSRTCLLRNLLTFDLCRELLYDVSYTVCILLRHSSAPRLCTTSVLGIMVSIGSVVPHTLS